ncbi:hypothetical protein BS47DRAFT_1392041 [Hydnum rufescens UP504]|uniref:Uncharacterized protein n=1 Tax=Hydnum rufescens UP504 TaxID=1448309 RepID=A0A9P6B005_9AGAM|nr:hypothetical protein BS47DRAFT_1392041 [Hydnum rufescens UP504]
MSSFHLLGHFCVTDSTRVKESNALFFNVYKTAVMASENLARPSILRSYAPSGTPLYEDETVLFIIAKAHQSTIWSGTFVFALGSVIGSPSGSGSAGGRLVDLRVSDFIQGAIRSSDVRCVPRRFAKAPLPSTRSSAYIVGILTDLLDNGRLYFTVLDFTNNAGTQPAAAIIPALSPTHSSNASTSPRKRFLSTAVPLPSTPTKRSKKTTIPAVSISSDTTSISIHPVPPPGIPQNVSDELSSGASSSHVATEGVVDRTPNVDEPNPMHPDDDPHDPSDDDGEAVTAGGLVIPETSSAGISSRARGKWAIRK